MWSPPGPDGDIGPATGLPCTRRRSRRLFQGSEAVCRVGGHAVRALRLHGGDEPVLHGHFLQAADAVVDGVGALFERAAGRERFSQVQPVRGEPVPATRSRILPLRGWRSRIPLDREKNGLLAAVCLLLHLIQESADWSGHP